LIGLIRVGGCVSYDENGFGATARLGRIRIKLYPREEKKPRAKKKPRGPAAQKEEEKPKKTGDYEALKALIKPALETGKYVFKGLRIDDLEIEYTAASDDPAKTAMLYGGAAAGTGALLPLIESAFRVRKKRIRVYADFTGVKQRVLFAAAVSIRLGRLMISGVKLLILYLKYNKGKLFKKKVVS